MANSGQPDVPVVQAGVGESFEIHLQSMQASTGYGWFLSGLPEGVALLGSSTAQVHEAPVVGPTRQTFVFTGLTELKATLEFRLLAPWKPTEQADRRVFDLIIGAEQADALEAEMGAGRFVTRAASMVHMRPVPPYGFTDEASLTKGGVVFPLYGFPPPGGGPHVNVIESAENCVLMYGVPMGIADRGHCTLKYGFPVNLAADADDIVIAYGFPPPGGGGPVVAVARGDKVATTPWEIKAVDEAKCVVKYGTPGGIGTDPSKCVLKYGFPVPKQ
jgi:hypothetical protein